MYIAIKKRSNRANESLAVFEKISRRILVTSVVS